MNFLWENGPSFVKEIIAGLPEEQKPHYNTISTIVRNLEDKGLIGHESFGKTHRYFAAVARDEYGKDALKDFVQRYFDNSYKSVVSMFVEEEDISLEEIRELIESARNQKQE